jgi:ribosomal protein S11
MKNQVNKNLARNNRSYKHKKLSKSFYSRESLAVLKSFKYKPYIIDTFESRRLFKLSLPTIYIKIRSNNIFCSLVSNRGQKTVLKVNGGSEGQNISRKRLKFALDNVLISFFNKFAKKRLRNLNLRVVVVAPIRFRKKIALLVSEFLKKKHLLFSFRHQKCFNGCRVPKRRRKKRKGLRLLK